MLSEHRVYASASVGVVLRNPAHVEPLGDDETLNPPQLLLRIAGGQICMARIDDALKG